MSQPVCRRSARSCAIVLAMITGACCWAPMPAAAQWVVLHDQNGVAARDIPENASEALSDLARKGAALKAIAFTPSGGWVILHDMNGHVAHNIPAEAAKTLTDLAKRGAVLRSIAFTPRGGWVILHGKNGFVARKLPEEAFQAIADFAKKGAELRSVTFAPDGVWVVVTTDQGYTARELPDDVARKLKELKEKGAALKAVAFTAEGGWCILFDQNGAFCTNVSEDSVKAIAALIKKGASLTSVTFVPRAPLILSRDDARTRDEVLKRLAKHNVPGVSIALIQDGKVAWARGYGLVRSGDKRQMTDQTRLQAASVSKPVSALAALLMVQDGKLHLDGDVNVDLVSWKVPDNDFTRKRRPTLRQILSHSAGFNVHGFGGYELASKVPTLLQILDGKGPVNSPAIRVTLVPGSKCEYSGGGYCVLQQLMIDVARKPFPKLMQETILGPLAMKHSTFAQPLPKDWEAEAAVGHDAKGRPIAGKWHIYPEMAPAGLWTTPSDLAQFVLALCQSHEGAREAILQPALAKAMFTRQIDDAGLGIFLSGRGPALACNHNGANAGYRCRFIGFPATGQGAVLMTNSDNGDSVINELLEALRNEYAWPN